MQVSQCCLCFVFNQQRPADASLSVSASLFHAAMELSLHTSTSDCVARHDNHMVAFLVVVLMPTLSAITAVAFVDVCIRA